MTIFSGKIVTGLTSCMRPDLDSRNRCAWVGSRRLSLHVYAEMCRANENMLKVYLVRRDITGSSRGYMHESLVVAERVKTYWWKSQRSLAQFIIR
jgi:hypothetical protein